MKYTAFCCYGNRISSLTKQEIKNPLSVLETIYTQRELKSFKENLWDLFSSIYRDQHWRKKGAAQLNRIYIDLIRLIDALWLIYTYHPQLCTPVQNNQGSIKTPGLMNNFNILFTCRRRNNKQAPRNTLKSFYKSRSLSAIKKNIYNYLQLALNASYMNSNKDGYFALPEYNVVDDFLKIEGLIAHGSSIYSNCSKQKPRTGKAVKFAKNLDHTTTLSKEEIVNPAYHVRNIYLQDLRFEQIYESIKIWEHSFYNKDFWGKTDNPGNILFFTECIKQLIDCTWLMTQTGELKAADEKKDISNSKRKQFVALNNQELNQPLLVISSFFEHKKMHEWKIQLDEWTEISLSQTAIPENKIKTSEDLNYLLKFVEASHLLTCL
ncbi:hypothetical protein FBD94_10765 [Pedobacter hiemivivus]|uniref:Uncharacterized protein n=1 Tax=Pedobacter hiemivivus TaxID=2530454 RepID=A0A4U1GAP9_9SPHI|nr:hypothetical protein [Pedobacter hiemivivus]TKC61025.1 hypothetical protein FBD94_10765 [Pedobacter hiemivivus]